MCSNFLSKFGRDVSSRRVFAMSSAWKDIPEFKSEKVLQMLRQVIMSLYATTLGREINQ